MEYLAIEIIIFIIFFLIHKFSKINLFKNKLQIIALYSTTLIFGSLWDTYAVWQGHWYYPGKGLLGIFIGYLPLEDYLFIIVVTYAIVVTYQFYNKKLIKNK